MAAKARKTLLAAFVRRSSLDSDKRPGKKFASRHIPVGLNISEGAVRARVDYLQKHEHLRFLAIIDPVEIGYMSWAVLGMKVKSGILPHDLAQYFTQLPETIWVAAVAGRYDLIVEVWTETPVQLNTFLDEHCHKPGKIMSVETRVGQRLHKWG